MKLAPCTSSEYHLVVLMGTLMNVKKTIGLISKTTTLQVDHTFLKHFFPVFARLRRENT